MTVGARYLRSGLERIDSADLGWSQDSVAEYEVLKFRLLSALKSETLYGDTPELRNQRAHVVDALNDLLRAVSGRTFLEWCDTEPRSTETDSQSKAAKVSVVGESDERPSARPSLLDTLSKGVAVSAGLASIYSILATTQGLESPWRTWSVVVVVPALLSLVYEVSRGKRRRLWVVWGAGISVALSLVLVGFSFFWPGPYVPRMPVELMNNTGVEVSVKGWGQYDVTRPIMIDNGIEIVGSGIVTLVDDAGQEAEYLSVDAGTIKRVFALFSRSAKLVPALNDGDAFLACRFTQQDGQTISAVGVVFSRENMGRSMRLELKPPN